MSKLTTCRGIKEGGQHSNFSLQALSWLFDLKNLRKSSFPLLKVSPEFWTVMYLGAMQKLRNRFFKLSLLINTLLTGNFTFGHGSNELTRDQPTMC